MESQSDSSPYIVNSGKPVWSNEFQAAYALVCMTAHSRSLCQYSEASIFLWCGTSQGISHLSGRSLHPVTHPGPPLLVAIKWKDILKMPLRHCCSKEPVLCSRNNWFTCFGEVIECHWGIQKVLRKGLGVPKLTISCSSISWYVNWIGPTCHNPPLCDGIHWIDGDVGLD